MLLRFLLSWIMNRDVNTKLRVRYSMTNVRVTETAPVHCRCDAGTDGLFVIGHHGWWIGGFVVVSAKLKEKYFIYIAILAVKNSFYFTIASINKTALKCLRQTLPISAPWCCSIFKYLVTHLMHYKKERTRNTICKQARLTYLELLTALLVLLH